MGGRECHAGAIGTDWFRLFILPGRHDHVVARTQAVTAAVTTCPTWFFRLQGRVS